ncbi:hypothetical protein CL617_03460 [archaeon]|nr:hypothetical protein [archaeon]|tara:strand:- start:11651 stop:12709 length:1059 start_codon:yes stop_codon:yes gene_type:complete
MNILLITRPLSPPWNEGGKNLAYNLARNINNHKIHILVREDFNESLSENIIPHKVFPSEEKFNLSYLEKLKVFLFLLEIKDIDVFHFIYTPERYSSFINRILIKLKKVKSIQTLPTRIEKILNLKRLIFADKIVTISEFTKNKLLENKIKNVVKINTGIDVDYFKPIKKINSNKTIILIPMELENKKSRILVLKLIRELKNIKNVLFHLVYRHKDEINEEKYIKNFLLNLESAKNVSFKKNKDIRQLISNADFVFYPRVNTEKKHEIPMILLECMAMEKPIIIWDIPPFNEIIDNEGIKVKSFIESKEAIIKLIENKKLRESYGKLSRKKVIKDFNIKDTTKEYEKLYKNFN